MLGDKSKSLIASLIVVAAAAGIARAFAEITGRAVSAAVAAAAGAAIWILLSALLARLGPFSCREAAQRVAWAFSPALLAWAAPPFLSWLTARQPALSFSQVGSLRIGSEWVSVPPASYLAAGFLGLALMGAVLIMAFLFWRTTRAGFVAAAVAVALAGAWRVVVFPPSGDEPYMLLSAISVLEDGDLDLRDEFREGSHEAVHPVSFERDFLAAHSAPGRGGALYNRHGILIPLLYAPGYCLAGRLGIQALLGIAWGLLLAQIFALLQSAGYAPRIARDAVGVLAIASPLPLFGIFLGPDLLSALLLASGVFSLIRNRPGVLLACIAILPWIHHKSALLSAGLVLASLLLHGPRRGAASFAALLVSLLLLVGLLVKFTAVTAWPPWEVFSFSAGRYQECFSAANIPTSLLAILFDRRQGLIHFPVLLLAFAGAAALYRQAPRLAMAVGATAAPYLAALLLYNQWHGGPGAPGRLVVLLLPAAALPLAAFIDASRKTNWGRPLLFVLCFLGGLTVWLIAGVPALAFVSAKLRVENLLQETLGFNALALFPDFSGDPPALAAHLRALPWLLLLGLLSFILAASFRRKIRRLEFNAQAGKPLRRNAQL